MAKLSDIQDANEAKLLEREEMYAKQFEMQGKVIDHLQSQLQRQAQLQIGDTLTEVRQVQNHGSPRPSFAKISKSNIGFGSQKRTDGRMRTSSDYALVYSLTSSTESRRSCTDSSLTEMF